MRRRVTLGISVAFHAALIAMAIAHSWLRVDELEPPVLRIDIGWRPGPRPKPEGGPGDETGGKPPEVVRKIFQPSEVVREVTEEPVKTPVGTGETTGAGGAGGGDGPGTGGSGAAPGDCVGPDCGDCEGPSCGGAGGQGEIAPPPVKVVPPRVGDQQKIAGEKPSLPRPLALLGRSYRVMARIAVSAEGHVTEVAILKSDDPLIDEEIRQAVAGWRYRPFTVNDRPVPFAYVAVFEFTVE